MSDHPSKEEGIAQLLAAWKAGRESAFDELITLVYDDLREVAHQQRQRYGRNYTLNTTALVHEYFLKLKEHPDIAVESLYGFSAVAMRRLLIDYARRVKGQKRGGRIAKVSAEEPEIFLPSSDTLPDDIYARADEVLAIDEEIKALEEHHELCAQVVVCRFFGGLTREQTANALGVSFDTVRRCWRKAKKFLRPRLQEKGIEWE